MSGKTPFTTAATVERFAEIVMPDELQDDEAVEVYALPTRRAAWAKSRAQLVELAVGIVQQHRDAYIGVSTKRLGLGTVTRGGEADTMSVLAVALDVDYGDAGHKPNGKAYPPTREVALGLLDDLPLRPSLVVGSGGGLHAWFVYKEPVDVREEGSRAEAKGAAAGWSRLFRSLCEKRGYTADSTYDLARLFRIAGTVNYKLPDNPRPVEILSESDERYALADFEPYATAIIDSYKAGLDGLVLRPDARAEPMKFAALLLNDDKFKATWQTQRPDLKDQSPSGYCLALANFAVRAGWSDQEVADLLIDYRRGRGADLKLREKWYGDTIALARDGGDGKRAQRTVEDDAVATQIDAVNEIEDFEGRRTEVLALLSQFTGIAVESISYTSRDPAAFLVRLAGGEQFVCDTKQIMAHRYWVERSFDFKALVPIKPPSKDNWAKLIANLARYVTEFDPVEPALVTMLREYLDGAIDLSTEDDKSKRDSILAQSRPVRLSEPNRPHAFSQQGFSNWLHDNRHSLPSEGLRARLRGLGFTPRAFVGIVYNGKTTTRRYWVAGPGTAARLGLSSAVGSDPEAPGAGPSAGAGANPAATGVN